MADTVDIVTYGAGVVEVSGSSNTVTSVTTSAYAVVAVDEEGTSTVEVQIGGDTVVEVADNRGPRGPEGPAGPPGDPQLHIGPTPPSDTSLIWVKTP